MVEDKSRNTLQAIQFSGLRGSEAIREVSLPVGDRILRIAVVHGLVHVKKLLAEIEAGTAYYDLVEVMTCKTGCVGGAASPTDCCLPSISGRRACMRRTGRRLSSALSATPLWESCWPDP